MKPGEFQVNCCRQGCTDPGTLAVRIQVWARLTPKAKRSEKNGITLYVGITVCEAHRGEILELGREMVDRLAGRITQGLRAIGRADPDFNSALVAAVPRAEAEAFFAKASK